MPISWGPKPAMPAPRLSSIEKPFNCTTRQIASICFTRYCAFLHGLLCRRTAYVCCQANLIGKGFLVLHSGKPDQALLQFDMVLSSDTTNIPASLGKACILFNEGKYLEAFNM